MRKVFGINRKWVAFVSIILLYLFLVLMMQGLNLQNSKVLNFAISLDLLFFVPLIYFLAIRKSSIPKTTVVPVMLVGFLLGSIFLPKQEQEYLAIFKTWFLPVIEISILSFIIYKVRKAVRLFKNNADGEVDFYTSLIATCKDILPKKVVHPFASEIAVFYYGFFHWKKVKLKADEFSYHKNTGTQALLGALIFIIAIETVVLHILILKWSEIAAIILSLLSIYSALQVFGILKSLGKRPIVIGDQKLSLRYGILSNSEIKLSEISSIELYKKEIDKKGSKKKLSPLGELEEHNVLITFKNAQFSKGLYGAEKSFEQLVLFVDEPEAFKTMINERKNKLN